MALKIDLLCNDGSPLGVVPGNVYGRGVGGAELAMLTWVTTMASRGHGVRVFNNPKPKPGVYDGVEFLPKEAFIPTENRDAFVTYRSPNTHTETGAGTIKIHWSMDQFTVGDYAVDIVPHVDAIVCISPYHVTDYLSRYHPPAEKIGYLDLGVKLPDYDGAEIRKIQGRCVFCSMPDRGLRNLHMLWSKILEREPEASLVITGDYTLWGASNPGNQQHRLQWLHTPNVKFLGNIPREQLVMTQLQAQVHTYPCIYKELFCIAAAECQVAGAVPITTNTGALATTNEFGFLLPGNVLASRWQQLFVEAVVAAMKMTEPERLVMQQQARDRFDWETICNQWEVLVQTGEFPQGQRADQLAQV